MYQAADGREVQQTQGYPLHASYRTIEEDRCPYAAQSVLVDKYFFQRIPRPFFYSHSPIPFYSAVRQTAAITTNTSNREIFPKFVRRLAVSYTHLRAHETRHDLVCRL